jgi:CRISPR-associated protein Csb2
MLAIKVEYLTGVCMATRHNDPTRSKPEWPPHPDRLFSALVAAAAEPSATSLEIPSSFACALKWLCKQGAPQLAAPEAHRRWAPDVHMPTNPHEDEVWQKPKRGKQGALQKSFDLTTLLPVRRGRKPLPIPGVIPEDPFVYFVWPDTKPEQHAQELEALRTICRRVTYLGRSRSLVRAAVADEVPTPTHVPDQLGQVQLRVPGPGRLSYLTQKYERDGGKPEPCPPQRYRKANGRARAEGILETVFERFWVFRPQAGDPSLPAISTLKVTQAFRNGLIACIEESQREEGTEPNVPDVVHGHGRHPHCAYVALPFVHPRQRYADGTIKGLAVLVPKSADEDGLLSLAAGLARLAHNGLGIPGVGTWHLTEIEADDPPNATLDPRTWTVAARVWTTATPIVFGHFPKPNKGGEPKVILESLRMIGVEPDRVVEIAVDRHSPLYGASASWCFKARQRLGATTEAPSWIRHVTLRFDQPVRGPIVLGSMRYFGLGLMRPLGE